MNESAVPSCSASLGGYLSESTAVCGLLLSRPLPMLVEYACPLEIPTLPAGATLEALTVHACRSPSIHGSTCSTCAFFFFTHNFFRRCTVPVKSLQELYSKQLSDLYSAEQQIIKALPKMIDATQSDELREALNEHLNVTRNQVSRLDQIFEQMGESPENEKCKGMEGVLQEGSELLKELEDEDVRDAGIIASAQRVEHYEIAGYGTARTYATLLGEDEAAELLQETLQEEKDADEKLNEIAEELNFEAMDSGEEAGGEEESDSEGRKSGRQLRGKASQKANSGRSTRKSTSKKKSAA